MFSKPLKDLELKDIEELTKSIDRNEGYKFDFKGAPPEKEIDKFEDKLIQAFTAFANAYGGYLILGVNETDKKSKTFEINGFPQIIKGKNTIEWINQVISGNVEPKLFYSDPKTIEIPGTDNIILVYFIHESSVKPHMANKEGKYYIRINDKSETAKHYTVRDMFETSRRRYDELNDFLEKRKLLNEDHEQFGQHHNSTKLKSSYFRRDGISAFPLLLYSSIPKLPSTEIVQTQESHFHSLIMHYDEGYEPDVKRKIMPSYENEINLFGRTFISVEKTSYIEFLNNGFFEQGLCDSVFYKWNKSSADPKERMALHITNCIGQLISLIHFSKTYYGLINYNDEIILQISIIGTVNFSLCGFNKTKGESMEYRNPEAAPHNTQHQRFKIIEKYYPKSITNDSVIQMAKKIETKILNAFGEDSFSRCFIDDKIDITLFNKEIRYII